MTLEQLIIWIIIGGIAGLLADALVAGTRLGVLEAIVVGILGAFVGGWLLSALGVFPPGTGIVGSILTAFIGAVVLLLLFSALSRRRR